MTEPIVPDPLADGIVSGSVDPATLPAELRGVAEVFAAAHQSPSADELVGMASAVGAFQAAVTTPAPSADPVPPRSVVTMFSTRIPKRAAVIVAATVLIAGTAAAAAGGASPFGSAGRGEIVELPLPGDETSTTPETTIEGDTTTTTEGDTTTTAESGDTSTTESGDTSTTEAAATESTYPGRDYGHCTAWGVGAPKSTETPGFRSLGESAEAAGLTVEEYCELVLAAHDGDDADDADDADDSSTSTSTDVTTAARTPGNGKGGDHGRGNGKGNGKP